jgi:hypothetical protein
MKMLDQKIKRIDPTRRKKVEARAAALIAEEMTLQAGGPNSCKKNVATFAFDILESLEAATFP